MSSTHLSHPLRLAAALCGAFTLVTSPQPQAAAEPTAPATGFVTAQGRSFALDGEPFRFGGTNNYYLHYKSPEMIQDVFRDAAAMKLDVIRSWAMIDRGSLDGTVPNVDGPGHKDGYYMQYWDPAAGRPAINDSETGLVQLDRKLAAAQETGIRVIMVLTNNWREFGGMDQYVHWRGGRHHDQFYTDPVIRSWYKDWARALVNRTNTITGEKYRDDPNIFAWELANEPRCANGNLSSSGTCTTDTITTWAGEMSSYIKGLDPNHMVSVGDEGFLAWENASDWAYNAGEGVDHEALTSLPDVDFGTFHLYPNHWGKSAEWGTQWIKDHSTAADGYGKPVVLEEFGFQDQGRRDAVYRDWTAAVRESGGDGWNLWILTGIQDDGSAYPDYDGFRVTHPSATATVLSEEATAIRAGSGDPDDVTPPTAPGAPAADQVTSGSVRLTWPPAQDNVAVTGYDVVRVADGAEIRLVSTTGTSATITGLDPDTAYTFAILARDAAGNRSPRSTTVTVTTADGPATGSCATDYLISGQWQGGFRGDITIRNNGTRPVNGWTLAWDFTAGQIITSLWGGTHQQSGARGTVTSADYTARIEPGASVTVGFSATWNGSNPEPTAITLNGQLCATT